MAYEEMKRWGFDRKGKQFAKKGQIMMPEDDKLVSWAQYSSNISLLSCLVQYLIYNNVRCC
jgi:hypothetical protein